MGVAASYGIVKSQKEETALSSSARLIFIVQSLNLTVTTDG